MKSLHNSLDNHSPTQLSPNSAGRDKHDYVTNIKVSKFLEFKLGEFITRTLTGFNSLCQVPSCHCRLPSDHASTHGFLSLLESIRCRNVLSEKVHDNSIISISLPPMTHDKVLKCALEFRGVFVLVTGIIILNW